MTLRQAFFICHSGLRAGIALELARKYTKSLLKVK